ncbi:hypothetical protein [Xanthomonas translucens]|uniref:hypothetical protein n=1 Tax=Xanthomonas campestris pv. translucens TaxID=343 RepID=UPI001CAA8A32|nr:hypothetical protein [Xanthomonas translucens]
MARRAQFVQHLGAREQRIELRVGAQVGEECAVVGHRHADRDSGAGRALRSPSLRTWNWPRRCANQGRSLSPIRPIKRVLRPSRASPQAVLTVPPPSSRR